MNRLREIRKSKNLTMKQLGIAVGVSESTISLYETGKHDPDILTLNRIADALGATVDQILGRDEEKKEAPASGLDDRLVDMLVSLSPDQVQRVMDFVAGMKAADKA